MKRIIEGKESTFYSNLELLRNLRFSGFGGKKKMAHFLGITPQVWGRYENKQQLPTKDTQNMITDRFELDSGCLWAEDLFKRGKLNSVYQKNPSTEECENENGDTNLIEVKNSQGTEESHVQVIKLKSIPRSCVIQLEIGSCENTDNLDISVRIVKDGNIQVIDFTNSTINLT